MNNTIRSKQARNTMISAHSRTIHAQIGTLRACQSCVDNINPFVIKEMVCKDFVGPPLLDVCITVDYLYIHTMQLRWRDFWNATLMRWIWILWLLLGTSIASTTTSPSAAGAGLGTGKAWRDGVTYLLLLITCTYICNYYIWPNHIRPFSCVWMSCAQ